MKEEKKVSIVVAAYNIESYISACLDSLVNQTYKNIEIIVIDDGSTDSTSEKASSYYEEYKNVFYYKKENGGLSSARNYGIEKSTGCYIMFVDGDDYLDVNAIKILMDKIKNNDILCFNYIVKNENYEKKQAAKYYDDESIEINYVLGQPSACTKIYKRSIFVDNSIRFNEGILYEDLALIPSLVLHTNKISFIDDAIYYYLIRNTSIMHSKKFSPKKDDKYVAIELLIERFKKSGNYEKYKEELEYIILKNLAVIYSMELLSFSSEIYKPRLKRAVEYIKENCNDYKNNKYFIRDSFKSKLFVYLVLNKKYSIAKMITILAKLLNKS